MDARIFTIDRIVNLQNSNWILKEITPDGYVNIDKFTAKTKKEIKEMILQDGYKKIGTKNLYKKMVLFIFERSI